MAEKQAKHMASVCVTVRALVLMAVSWTAGPACSQDNQPAKKADDLYWVALTASVKEMDKQWGNLDVIGADRIRIDFRNMPVLQNREITENLPTVSGEYRFSFLNDHALLERFRTEQKEFAVLEIHPAHNDGQRLQITVSLSWVSDLNGTLMFGTSDWSDVEFAFDCKKQTYVVSSVKLGGI